MSLGELPLPENSESCAGGKNFGTTNAALNLARVTATYSFSGDLSAACSPSSMYLSIGTVGKIKTLSNVLPLATPMFIARRSAVQASLS